MAWCEAVSDHFEDNDEEEDEPEVLIPVQVSMQVTEDYCESLVTSIVESMEKEEMISTSSRGQLAIQVLKCAPEAVNSDLSRFSVLAVRKLEECLVQSKTRSSISVAKLWKHFHKIRFSTDIERSWENLLATLQFSSSVKAETNLALQLLLDRLMKAIISRVTAAASTTSAAPSSTTPQVLTMRERNVVRYVAGYVVMKLRKKYLKKTKTDPEKRKWFSEVLDKMKAGDEMECISAVEDYTTYWVRQVDRGGLYRIDNKVQALMEEVESVTRKHLDTRKVPNENITSAIWSDILKQETLLGVWRTITQSHLPPNHEWSKELLCEISELWITIRAHAFAQGWAEKFEKSFKKGTRKTLKSRGTDKQT